MRARALTLMDIALATAAGFLCGVVCVIGGLWWTQPTYPEDGGRCSAFCLERGFHLSRARVDGCECRAEWYGKERRR